MKDYFVDIKTPNRFITVNNKKVRTPTKFKIPERDLKALHVTLKHESITDYRISEFSDVKEEEEDAQLDQQDDIFIESYDVIIENSFEEEPKTTLEKLLKASEMEKKDEVNSSHN